MKKVLCCLLLVAVAVAVADAGKPQHRGRGAVGDARVSEVAMADSTWISTDGNLNAAGSWSPSGVPGANGNVICDSSSNYDISSGLTALTAVDLTSWWIKDDYEGNIGAAGNPLTTAIKRFVIQGSGSVWYDQQTNGTEFLQFTVVNSPNQQDALTIVGLDGVGDSDLYCIDGGVQILDGAGALTYMTVSPKNSYHLPNIQIGTGVTCVHYMQSGGSVTTKSKLGSTTFVLDGGTLTYDKSISAAWTSTILIAGGTMYYNGTGAATRVIVTSGTLDMSQDARAKTISYLVLLPGARFVTHNNITVTTMVDLREKVPVLP